MRPRHDDYALLDGRRISLPPPIHQEAPEFCCHGECTYGETCPRRREVRRQAANKVAAMLVVLILVVIGVLGLLLAFRR